MAEQLKRAKLLVNLSQTGVKCSLRLLKRGTKHQENAPTLYLAFGTTGVKCFTKCGDKPTARRHAYSLTHEDYPRLLAKAGKIDYEGKALDLRAESRGYGGV